MAKTEGTTRCAIACVIYAWSLIAWPASVEAEDVRHADAARDPRALAMGVALASLASAAAFGGAIAELAREPRPRASLSDLDGHVRAVIGGALLTAGVGLLATGIGLGIQRGQTIKQRRSKAATRLSPQAVGWVWGGGWRF